MPEDQPTVSSLLSRIKAAIPAIEPDVIAWRRHLHAHPELSDAECETSRFVVERMREFGIEEIEKGIGGYGVVATIRGGQKGEQTVALRADLDALPVCEETGLPFTSENHGVMHACGHDTHMAMLLGAAKLLHDHRDQLPGNVKIIFQPAEEGSPDGVNSGAPRMIEAGLLDAEPKIDAMFGMHIAPSSPCGRITYCYGSPMSAVDRFRVTLHGKQGHGAAPQSAIDPIVASAHVISALQTIVARNVDPRQTAVLSVGNIESPGRWNIIPESVSLEGTVRTFDPNVSRQITERFHEIVSNTASALGVVADISYQHLNPPLQNDRELVQSAIPALEWAAGEDMAVEGSPWLAGEDFAHFAARIPCGYFFLGAKPPETGVPSPLHSPTMRIDEAALPIGVRAYVALAIRHLFDTHS